MPKFNDFDLDNWKDLSDIETNSLWLIDKRDNSGKHDGFYHGNFVPQVPRQLIQRFTKKNDVVFDPFLGSGTTAFECEMLNRNFIGVDINPEMVNYVNGKLSDSYLNDNYNFICCLSGDSTKIETINKVNNILNNNKKEKIQLAILHPPYFDIVKFTDNKDDLSNSTNLNDFLDKFDFVIKNTLSIMQQNGYLAVVIGDKYCNSEWVPLGFQCMQKCIENKLLLKSIIVKNMEGNRAKSNQNAIWRYRALSSDYYIFKHEYIFLFKKVL